MSTDWNLDSLDFILNHIREAPEKQIQTAEALDAKMVQIFVSASIVIGLVGLSSSSLTAERWVTWALIGALFSYLPLALFTFFALGPKRMRRNLQADELWPDYVKYALADIKEVLAQDTSDAYAFNRGVLADKAKTMKITLTLAALEVIFVGIAIAIPLFKAWFT